MIPIDYFVALVLLAALPFLAVHAWRSLGLRRALPDLPPGFRWVPWWRRFLPTGMLGREAGWVRWGRGGVRWTRRNPPIYSERNGPPPFARLGPWRVHLLRELPREPPHLWSSTAQDFDDHAAEVADHFVRKLDETDDQFRRRIRRALEGDS